MSVVDGSASYCDGWHQDETQHQTLEQRSLPLGLDQGVVEDEDISVEADAGVDESVDESEEEDNESDEAEVVVGVYLRSGGANHVNYSEHAVHDYDPV